ncbi:C40 family peptidase [Candidatus Uhrbacteria bacterium]|nr:C40 family peptidase [Candidatus Uhrbacteria bacterium]
MSQQLVCLARTALGRPYRLSALAVDAPECYNCLSLICSVLKQVGIHVEQRLEHLSAVGTEVPLTQLRGGDILFTSGLRNWYNGLGHVGLAASPNTVIHACYREKRVVEVPLERFIGRRKFYGARRILLHA